MQSAPKQDELLLSQMESILLVAGEPVSIEEMANALGERKETVRALVPRLQVELARGIRVQVHRESLQLVTAPENAAAVQRYAGTTPAASLSRAAFEALTVIAYRQPVTRAEVEAIRGVNSDRVVQALLARGLIEERGQRATPGHPAEYGTSFAFLEYFGLRCLDDLPALAEPVSDTEVNLGLHFP